MTVGEELWQHFVSERQRLDPTGSAIMVLGHSYTLLGDALKCYDAGSPNGATLLCRATVETACYLFLTRKKDPGSTAYLINPPLTLAGDPREVSFEEIKGGAAKSGIFSAEQLAAISRIQVDGNFVAHLGSRQDREFTRALDRMREEGTLGKGPGHFSARELVSAEEAKKDLEDAVEILLVLWREVTRQMSVPPVGPSLIGAGGRNEP